MIVAPADALERHQIPIDLTARAVGAATGTAWLRSSHPLELAIYPVLGTLLYATFLQSCSPGWLGCRSRAPRQRTSPTFWWSPPRDTSYSSTSTPVRPPPHTRRLGCVDAAAGTGGPAGRGVLSARRRALVTSGDRTAARGQT